MKVSHSSLFLDEGQQVTVSPPALPHTDLDSSSNDEKDDEAFQDYVLSPAPSSASDSSCSTTNICMLFWDASLLCHIIF